MNLLFFASSHNTGGNTMPAETPLTIHLVTDNKIRDLETKIRQKLTHAGYTFVTAKDDPTITIIISFDADNQETVVWIRRIIEDLIFGGYIILIHNDLRKQHPDLFNTTDLPEDHHAKDLVKAFDQDRDIIPMLNSILQFIDSND
ncbi:hypothetical protein HOD19_00370 [bacterium]|jgi:hypothetical protein|nr:hypothetical protein [bacterium]